MNREILFRGKELNSGKWVYGYLWSKRTIGVTSPVGNVDEVVVDPATVGQCTGLPDRNGKRIFEGDIIQRKGYIYPLGKQEPCGERIVRGEVIWIDDGHNAGFLAIDSKDEHGNPTTYSFDNKFCVVGNIYDHPELLEGNAQ